MKKGPSVETRLAQVKRELQGYMKKWVPATGLGWWSIEAVWEYDTIGGPESAVASTYMKWEYMEASVVFNLPKMLNLEPKQREEVVVHELCHLFFAEIPNSNADRERWERGVTLLQHAFMWVRKATQEGKL